MAVNCRGEVTHRGMFGLADMKWRQPVASDTVFTLASLSEPFTAMTITLLSRDGLVDLDAPASTYLPRPLSRVDQLTEVCFGQVYFGHG